MFFIISMFFFIYLKIIKSCFSFSNKNLKKYIYLKKLTKEESDDWKGGEGRQDYGFSQFGK